MTEFPLVVNPLRLLLAGRPFIENFRWESGRGTRFWVVSKDDGRVRSTHQADAFFAFHHVNAFERGDDIELDVSAYPDSGIIESFYLKNIRSGVDIPRPEVRRYHLARKKRGCSYEVLSSGNLRASPDQLPAQQRRRVSAHLRRGHPPATQLHRRVGEGRCAQRRMAHVVRRGYVSRRACVRRAPGASREDEGVILAVVFDGKSGTSFLLALDGETFEELGRAVGATPHPLRLPWPVPYRREHVGRAASSPLGDTPSKM